jgi:hypothetical protein
MRELGWLALMSTNAQRLRTTAPLGRLRAQTILGRLPALATSGTMGLASHALTTTNVLTERTIALQQRIA